jgi:hypothetical protein
MGQKQHVEKGNEARHQSLVGGGLRGPRHERSSIYAPIGGVECGFNLVRSVMVVRLLAQFIIKSLCKVLMMAHKVRKDKKELTALPCGNPSFISK